MAEWEGSDGFDLFLEAETFDTELLKKQLKTKLPYSEGTAKNSGLCLDFR